MPSSNRPESVTGGAETEVVDRENKRIRWHRVLLVGGWLVLAFAALVNAKGPFWRSLDPWLEQIDDAILAEDWEGALQATRHALDIKPEDGGLLATAGHAHLRLGAPDSAATWFQKALEADSSRVDVRLGLGEAWVGLGDLNRAAAAVDPVDPDSLDVPELRLLAAIHESTGRLDEALGAHQRLPDAETRSDRVRLHRALGDIDSAVLVQRTLVEAEPTEIQHQRDLAMLLVEGERPNEAEDVYRTLVEVEDLEHDVLRYAWLLNEDGRHAEALLALDDPAVTSVQGLGLRVQTLVWLGRANQAESRLTAALEAYPSAAGLIALREDVSDLRAEMARRARIAAERDTPPAEPERALQFWSGRLSADPADKNYRRETVAILEQLGRFEEARDVLAAGSEARSGDAGTLLRLATLSDWGMDRDAQQRWLRAYEDVSGPLSDSLTVELAEALMGTGRPHEASLRLRPLVRSESPDSATLALAVLAAEEAEDLGEVASALDQMRSHFELTNEGLRRLGDAHRALDQLRDAIDVYSELSERAPADADVLAALGDLRSDVGDHAEAVEAYEGALDLGASVDLRLAAELGLVGRRVDAAARYRAYVEENPENVDARVLLARALAEIGEESEAIPHYVMYADRGSEDVSLELARAYLATEQYAEAVVWSGRAVEVDASWDARMVRAQALRFEGRRGEAEALLDTLSTREIEGAAGSIWHARIAWLRDQPVRVQKLLDPLLEDGAASQSGEGFLLLADAAFQRGDLGQAADAVRAARDAGAPEHRVERIEEWVVEGLKPSTGVWLTFASDDADIGHTGLNGHARARVDEGGVVRVEVTPHMISQGSAELDVTQVEVGLDSVFASRALTVSAAAGVQAGPDTESDITARVEAEYTFDDASTLGLRLTRDMLWSGQVDPGPLRLMRLRTLTPSILEVVGSDVRVGGSKSLGIGRSVYAEGGYTSYSDDNARRYAYARIQLPLQSAVDRWLALQPNLYLEDFSTQADGYVSPAEYLSVGLRGQGIWGEVSNRLRLEVNPHFFRFSEDDGVGIEVDAEWTRDLGPAKLLMRALYFNQGDLYDTTRITFGITFPFGGS